MMPYVSLITLNMEQNRINEIRGLQANKLLRVLKLGKNNITKIQNLETMMSLRILDLHANSIS